MSTPLAESPIEVSIGEVRTKSSLRKHLLLGALIDVEEGHTESTLLEALADSNWLKVGLNII